MSDPVQVTPVKPRARIVTQFKLEFRPKKNDKPITFQLKDDTVCVFNDKEDAKLFKKAICENNKICASYEVWTLVTIITRVEPKDGETNVEEI